MVILWFFVALILSGLVVVAVVFFARFSFVRTFLRSLDLNLILVRFPAIPQKDENQKEPLQEINVTAQFLNSISGLKIPFVIEVAVPVIGEEIHFYLGVPRNSVDFVTKQINGLWPDAQIEKSEDYTIFNTEGNVAAAYLKLKHASLLPVRTYTEAQVDTFAPILNNFSKVKAAGEGLALQIIVKPAPQGTQKNLAAMIDRLKKGGQVIGGEKYFNLGSLKDMLYPDVKKEAEKKETRSLIVDQETVKAAEQKIGKPIFNVNVRLVASATTPFRADELLDSLVGSFNQFTSPLRNEFKTVKARNPHKLAQEFIFRNFSGPETMTLGTDELTSIFHFPTATIDVPKIKSFKAKESSPPTILPDKGVVIGESLFRGERRSILISEDDRRRHVYVVGQTGTGKSVLLSNMAVHDIEAGKGICLIDPHGDLIDSILSVIPKHRYDDVIIFDPGDIERPLGLNMLEYDHTKPEQKTFIVNEMMNIFEKLYDLKQTGGPMFEQYMRNALLLLMEDTIEPATLMEVPRIFTDPEFRKKKISRAHNPTVIDFWEKEATKTSGEASLANMTTYVGSKFNIFIANDYVRPIIGQVKSALKFREIMDQGKILLVNLSKGRIGDINASLIGMVIIGKILMAALSRVDTPQEARRDFNLYIDEFQNFATDSISTILSEARKYRLNLVIAHQFIAQLLEKIRDAVFGNVGSLIVFRVGAEDAEFLEKQFVPTFTKGDLINIDNRNAYVKLLINGQTTAPFNIKTLPPKKGNTEINQSLRDLSRLTYGRDRKEVEEEILKRLRI